MRFKEWEGEWVSASLGDICAFYKGGVLSKAHLSEDGKPCILYGQLYTTYLSEAITTVFSRTSIRDSSIEKSSLGDLIIPCSGETAEDIATARCVLVQDVLYGGDLNVLRSQSHDCLFLSFQLNGKRRMDVAKLAVGKTVVHLHAGDLKKLKVYCPSNIDEERKVAHFLSILNQRIEVQNKIIEELFTLKKALYNKVFGTDAFNCRNITLCHFMKMPDNVREMHPDRHKLITVRLNEGGVIKNTNVETLKMASTIYYRRSAGQFIYGKQNIFHGAFGIVPRHLDGYASSGDVPALDFKEGVNSSFLMRSISFSCYNWEKYASGTGSKRIHEKSLLELQVRMPSSGFVERLEKMFAALEQRIERNRRTLNLYLTQKRFLLSHLFI